VGWPTSVRFALRFIALCLFGAANGHATSFTLEAGSVLLYEDEGRTSFNVTNTGNDPILLVSKVEDLKEGDIAHRILLTPPITRIEPRQSQLIHYILREGETLQREHMLAASFEAIPVKSQNTATINVNHVIPLIAYPKSIARTDDPWRDLVAQYGKGSLEIRNNGKHVVRLLSHIRTHPQGTDIALEHPYLMPGETTHHALSEEPKQIRITPMNRRGTVLQSINISVNNPSKE
jgi:P pilus assembly chaperone PapD